MTVKERAKFDKRLEDIANKAERMANELCSEISIPLEIEALEKMVDGIQHTIEVKKYILNRIKEKKQRITRKYTSAYPSRATTSRSDF